jgi:hypothetical protein
MDVLGIFLSYVRTGVKDDVNAYYWAPAWAVVYKQSTAPDWNKGCVFYINAVDGTFIQFGPNY